MNRFYIFWAPILYFIVASPCSADKRVDLALNARFTAFCFSPDSKYLVSADSERQLIVWDTKDWKQHKVLDGNLARGRASFYWLDFITDDKFLGTIVGGDDVNGYVDIFVFDIKAERGEKVSRIPGFFLCASGACKTIVTKPQFRVDSNPIAVATNIGTGDSVGLKSSGKAFVATIAPDGKSVLTFSSPPDLQLWDLRSGKELWKSPWMGIGPPDVSFSKDGRYILTSGSGLLAEIWKAETGKRIFKPLPTYSRSVFSSDGKYVVSCHLEEGLKIFPVDFQGEYKTLPNRSNIFRWEPQKVLCSPDGRFVAAGGNPGVIRVWEFPR